MVNFFETHKINKDLFKFESMKLRIRSNINWIKKSINPLINWSHQLSGNQTNYRLPSNLKPSLYQLEIRPFLTEKPFSFDGKCNITFRCVVPTSEIIFHSQALNIDEDKLELTSLDDINIRLNKHTIIYDSKRNFVIIKTNKNCSQDVDYNLFISYNGVMSYKLNGFYISSYIDKEASLQ